MLVLLPVVWLYPTDLVLSDLVPLWNTVKNNSDVLYPQLPKFPDMVNPDANAKRAALSPAQVSNSAKSTRAP